MSETITWRDAAQVAVTWGGAVASALSEGAKEYTLEVQKELAASGQTVLTETRKFEIFATEQAKKFRNLHYTANVWANAADAAGKNGIADIIRRYGDKALLEADKVLTGMVDEKQWLDNVVADANAKINVANQTIAKVGGTAGKLFGPIIDAAQMMAGAWQYQQTGESSDWENACAGVAASWAAAGLAVLLLPSAATVVTVSLVAAAAAGAGSYFGGQYFQDLKESLLSSSWFIDGVDAIAEEVNTNFLAAKNWVPPRDPLVLDLDGDGIETVGINPSAPILFDHNGDGVKTATGWIKADDGMLVLERDGNGLIETGRELFGDATVLEHGARAGQLAANGYEALADLDGNADGVLDSSDAAWGQLRVWRDQNQDGISQAGELHSLDALGIASLGVQGTQNRVDLGGGNIQTLAGTYTRSSTCWRKKHKHKQVIVLDINELVAPKINNFNAFDNFHRTQGDIVRF